MDDKASPASKQSAAEPPKKSSLFRKLLYIVGGILLLATFVGGVFLGPKLLSSVGPKHGGASAEAEKEEPPPAGVAQLEAIVIDLRESTGEMHHLKVGIAIELVGAMHGEEFKVYEPRARDAAISYLRTLTFDEVTNPTQLERIRTTLGERIATAVGKKHVKRVLFTEYVAQ